MSDQSKFYDYYMVEGDEVKSLIAGYDDIREQRNSILPEAAGKVGAIAWTTSSGWGGGGGLLNGFVWEKGYQFPCPMTIKREEMFDGKRVACDAGTQPQPERFRHPPHQAERGDQFGQDAMAALYRRAHRCGPGYSSGPSERG